MVLIEQLPPGSAFARSLYGEAATWTPAAYLAAVVADLLASANWQRGGGKGPRPKPIPRPNPEAKRKQRSYVGRLRNLGLLDQ